MSSEADARAELIRLLDGKEERTGGWRIVYDSARRPGNIILPRYRSYTGTEAIREFIFDRLQERSAHAGWRHRLASIQLRSGEEGWVMEIPDAHGLCAELRMAPGRALYVKLKIATEDDMAVILSFHESNPHHDG